MGCRVDDVGIRMVSPTSSQIDIDDEKLLDDIDEKIRL